MLCAFIPVDFDIGMRRMHLFHLLGWNMCIELSEMQLHGRLGMLRGVVANAARVITYSDVGRQAPSAEPGLSSDRSQSPSLGIHI